MPQFVKVMPKDYKRMLQAYRKCRRRVSAAKKRSWRPLRATTMRDGAAAGIDEEGNCIWENQLDFWNIERELPADRDPLERIMDWDEFHLPFDEEKLRTQGARCMDCGIPFCHTGK